MNVQSINKNQRTNFGMALHIPEKQVFVKKLGKEIAEEIESARGSLKNLAKDVDIFVEPSSSSDLTRIGEDTIAVTVKKPLEKGSNILKRILNYLNNTYFSNRLHVEDGNIAENLILEAGELKAKIK